MFNFLIKGYKNKGQQLAAHFVFWLLYISFYSLLVSIPSDLTFIDLFQRTLYFLPVDILVTYVTIYWLLPSYLIRKRYLLFSIGLVVLGFATVLVNQVINYYIYLPKYLPEVVEQYAFWQFNYFYSLVSTFAVALFAAVIKLTKYWIKDQQQRVILESQTLKSELALLKTQINPHFIFNTLNNIDTLIANKPEKASESIIKLSDIMRYVLYEATADYVPLDKEIRYLQSFIELHALRLGEGFINFQVSGTESNRMIAPMLFIPLVENAIKHGDKKVNAPGITICLTIEDSICFEVINYLSPVEINKDGSGGIGLTNLKRRLELLYPFKHELYASISDNKKFISRLCIH